ncbi:MAG TPA: xanthine dehydrogenase family protein molybdopterin-binding subunit [Burkholderiales bacterium]|nr:xanthine dehydrogenase family protein molybdopterin-binding subunit [Burkholderiales bacterium]
MKTKIVGQSVPRLEDLPLVTGRGCFVGDVMLPGQLHMRVVRSGHAHGDIVAIDVSQARAAAGVVAVWTAADVSELRPIALREGPDPKLDPYLQPVLAVERVRYVGEPVAVVFAEDAYLAEDAADLVNVEVRELPVVLAAHEAPAEFAPGRSTEPLVIRKGYGDVEAAERAAHAVVELDLSIGRHSGVPLETRGAIARYDAERDLLQMYGAAKVPHRTRDGIARVLGRDPAKLHLYEGHVGGGFGVRGEVYPEDALACLGALRLGRPVKWIEDRYEHLVAANHSRQQRHRVRAAVDATGRILAIDDVFFHDQGAYPRTHGARVVDLTSGMLPGPYHVPAYRVVAHYRLTNKTPAATYRSPGRFEGTFVRERLLDAIADRLGLDRIEVRRRNLIPKTAIPYRRELDAIGDEVVLDSGDYSGLLDKALNRIGWDALRKDLDRRRAAGETVGAGVAMFLEKSGLGPRDGAHVNVDEAGDVEVVTGSASLGQGVETVMAQICADALGVDYRRVRVIHGQTERIAKGIGAHASRATVMTGSAVHVAASNVRAKAIEAAAGLMRVPADALDIVNGKVVRKDSADAISIDLGEVARTLADGRGPGLTAEGWFETEHMNYPYGVHVAVVSVDRETGGVAVERYLVAYDVGRAINPMLVEGQMAGGFAQGLGGALLEEFQYDARGQPLSVTFADYLLPTARETPMVDVIVSEDAPSPLNPLGIKGAGEGGVPGVGAALAAAIDDAIGVPGAVTCLPVTPMRMKEILDRAGGRTIGDP